MKKIILILFFVITLFAKSYPLIFEQLGTPLFEQKNNFLSLQKTAFFHSEQEHIEQYKKDVTKAIEHGQALDNKEAKDTRVYLTELRDLQKLHDKIEKSYKHKLYKSINENNISAFYSITAVPLPFISSDSRLKKSVVHFYQNNRKEKIAYLEELSSDYELDENSYAFLEKMFQTRQKDQKVQRRKALDEFFPDPYRKRPIEVIMIKTENGFDLYLENHAYYDVSIQLKTVKIENLSSSEPLPYTGSFSARSRTKFLSLRAVDLSRSSLIQTQYSTQMGRLNPSYDSNYLYALPYKRDESYILTQGYNGKHTHKGQSAYALDFKMPIGTALHAMRNGIVVALESKNSEHGYSQEFLHKSNYIIIQHSDGTMAMYGHLKPNGVKVRLGQRISKHQYIGLSGNTGYSSGPHLHVHITAIKSFQSGSSSVPFKFRTQQGVITSPQEKSVYICK